MLWKFYDVSLVSTTCAVVGVFEALRCFKVWNVYSLCFVGFNSSQFRVKIVLIVFGCKHVHSSDVALEE